MRKLKIQPNIKTLSINDRYTKAQQLLHWIIAFLVISNVIGGFILGFSNGFVFKGTVRNFHKLIGIIVLFLTFWRIGLRIIHPAPPLPLSKLNVIVAKISHMSLYSLLIVNPLSGWIMSSAVNKMPWGLPTLFFIPLDKRLAGQFYDIHQVLGYLFATLISIHIFATLYHVYKGDPILQRMLPKSKNST